MNDSRPRLLVLSTLFPRSGTPFSGLFIRERMFRVARQLPISVVSPQPWFPGQKLIRLFKPAYRPPSPQYEVQQGVVIHCPRFFSLPKWGRQFDGFFVALSVWLLVKRKRLAFDIIDAHFAYPDGYAGTLLKRWLGKPCCITLRGTEVPLLKAPARASRLCQALKQADLVIGVAGSLGKLAIDNGASQDKVTVVGNGVDTDVFYPVDKHKARKQLGLPHDAKVMVTVGGLVPRKGFHRVLGVMPQLMQTIPNLHYVIVGGASPEGDMQQELEVQAEKLGLKPRVHFLGKREPDQLRTPLSAADVFVLATSNEGWANVFLEAMACGLPVVTTDVGGNAEVVSSPEVGMVVPFDSEQLLAQRIRESFSVSWNKMALLKFAQENNWQLRADKLSQLFRELQTNSIRQNQAKTYAEQG